MESWLLSHLDGLRHCVHLPATATHRRNCRYVSFSFLLTSLAHIQSTLRLFLILTRKDTRLIVATLIVKQEAQLLQRERAMLCIL